MKWLLVFSLLVVVCAAVPTQLTYTIGKNYVYNVTGIVQNNGYDTSAQAFVPGFYSTMQAVMVMQPIEQSATAYLFVMNLFDTFVSVSNTSAIPNPPANSGDSLGDNVYFTQLKTGEITEIQYYSDDPIYYVNVKISAINAFQTAIVAVGNTKVVLESDPIGNHSSQVSGAAGADGSLFLTKVFSQVDFTAFPDPTLTPANLNINAKAVTGIHAEGYVMSSALDQVAILTSAAPSQSKRTSMTNSTGLDMDLSAVGSLSVQYATKQDYLTTPFAPKSDGYVAVNMFNFAAQAGNIAKANAATINIKLAVKMMLDKELPTLSTLTKIGNHLRYNPEDAQIFVTFLENGFLEDPTFRDNMFFVLTVAQNQDLLVKYGLTHTDCAVVLRAVLATPHFSCPPQCFTEALLSVVSRDECPVAQAAARSIVFPRSPVGTPSSFPFNKSVSESVHLGGHIAGTSFSADLFAGTNFNCKTSPFNYEAYAEGKATAFLFGYAQEAFDAKIIYGQENGAPFADALTLSVWGKVVYDHALPTTTCKADSYTLAHTAPGFSVEHTLWVSIIPIVFSASASLDLTALWGWDVCPTQLSADIYANGNGAIALSGSSYTDLILLRAGFDLEAGFNTAIIPKAYVEGTLCQIGFEIDANNAAMTASFISYNQWRQCKVLFIDCKWGNHNQQTWWHWDEPAKDTVLVKETFQIA